MNVLLDRAPDLDGSRGPDEFPTPGYRIPGIRPRRKWPLAAVSAITVFASIALFAHLYGDADRQTSVLVVTRAVDQGQMLAVDDLGQAAVSVGRGVATIPVDRAAEVIGKLASVTLTSGSLLVPADLSSAVPVSAGDAVVGLALKEGQLPAAGVSSGDQVMVVETGALGSPIDTFQGSASTASTQSTGSSIDGESAGAAGSPVPTDPNDDGGGPSGVLVPQATVFDTSSPGPQSSEGVTELVSLEVSTSVAPAVSTASAAGQVTLVLVPDTASGTGSVSSSSSGTGSGRTSSATPRSVSPVRPAAKRSSAGGGVGARSHARAHGDALGQPIAPGRPT